MVKGDCERLFRMRGLVMFCDCNGLSGDGDLLLNYQPIALVGTDCYALRYDNIASFTFFWGGGIMSFPLVGICDVTCL